MQEYARAMNLPVNRYLGKLCLHGHNFEGTGRTLRFTSNRHCVECYLGMRKRQWDEDGAYRQQQGSRDRKKYEKNKTNPAFVAKNRAKTRKWFHEVHPRRWQNDPQYRLRCLLRSRTRAAFRKVYAGGVVPRAKDLGLDYDAVLAFLGPCPGDPTKYHIDHIRPLASYPDLKDPAQARHALAPENHQWLLATANLKKHATWKPSSSELQPWDQAG